MQISSRIAFRWPLYNYWLALKSINGQMYNSMVALLRQFLVMLLVGLQFAAPLVHAHVHDLGTSRGLHLHEFETLQLKSDASFMAALDYATPVQSAIVELGAAINVSQDIEPLAPIYSSYSERWLPEQYIVETINFSPHETALITEPFLNQHASRAPPRLI